jgi:hypothetical protein
MKNLKGFIALLSLMGAIVAVGALRSDAQVHGRRIIVVHRPIWHGGFYRPYGFYDPFYDPYFYDPYLRAQREKYYLQREVKDKRKDLAKHQEKYRADGYISPKEQEKLMKDRQKYAKAIEKLNKYNRDY